MIDLDLHYPRIPYKVSFEEHKSEFLFTVCIPSVTIKSAISSSTTCNYDYLIGWGLVEVEKFWIYRLCASLCS